MMIPHMNRCVSLCFSLFLAFHLPYSESYAHEEHENHCSEMAEHELGGYTFPITTSNPEVQKLMNQGMNWAFGFNHDAAEERFLAAIKLDPECAMCYWGLAYVKGPNINAPMTVEAVPVAWTAVEQAMARIKSVSSKEQALIRALATRYMENPPADRQILDKAYAAAMRAAAAAHPEDENIATLAAEALMDTMPWNYWTTDGKPREGTEEMIASLKRVLDKNPVHPGAIHFLIHIVEKVRPELAEAEADRLVNLVPGAGHLVHMASHIYIRVGRYHDASRVNEEAIKADQEYITMCPATSGYYHMLYVPHNYEFLVAVASLEGREALARQTAQGLRKYIEPLAMQSPEAFDLQQFWSTPLLVAVKFKDGEGILKEAAPKQNWAYATALWHFARAKAFAHLGQAAEAEAEISKMETLAQAPEMKAALLAGLNPASTVLSIGVEEAKGELAKAQKDYEKAVEHLTQAVAIQDALTYIEPPAWYQSARLNLGDVYQMMGRPADAERTFRDDLKDFPKNGWALFGLYKSLSAQQRLEEASKVLEEYKTAWQYADAPIGPDQAEIKL
jgi:tetratricopeptide (TPR) repeat protein